MRHAAGSVRSKLLQLATLLAVIPAGVGCATMFRGTTQQISINTDPAGATATLSDGRSCTTPCTLEAKRKNSLQVTIEKPGCNTTSTAMVPTLSGAGAILGGLIDYGTGAVYDLQPNPLFVKLTCRGGEPPGQARVPAPRDRRSSCHDRARTAAVPEGADETDYRLTVYEQCVQGAGP